MDIKYIIYRMEVESIQLRKKILISEETFSKFC